MRLADQERIATKETVCDSSQEGHAVQGHTGRHQGQREARARGNCRREPLLWFVRKEWGRQSKDGLRMG